VKSFDLGAIMDAIADAAVVGNVVVAGKAYAYPAQSISPPCLVVGYPEDIEFDLSFTGGSHQLTMPVWVAVGMVADKTARDRISALVSGVSGFKEALEGNLGGTVQVCHVVDCKIETITVAAVDYLAGKFTLEIAT
jgi:hypothetical protein